MSAGVRAHEATADVDGGLGLPVALMALACIVLGAATSHVPMVGLLGLPLALVGGALLAAVATSARGRRDRSVGTESVGMLLEVLGCVGLASSALMSSGLAWHREMGLRGPSATIHEIDELDLVLAAAAWLLLPTLIVAGLSLRTRWNPRLLVRWWLMTFAAQPAAVLLFLLLAATGAPLSA